MTNLNDKYKPKTYGEIAVDTYSLATYIPNLIRVYVPQNAITQIPEGWGLWEPERKTGQSTNAHKESNLERSVRRTRRTVYDLVLCNQFELFATFTVANNRYDDEASKNKILNWHKNQRVRNGKFKYLVVPEHHDDGALHFHSVISGYAGKLKTSKSKHDKPIIKFDKPVYEFPEYRSGFTSAQKIGSERHEQSKVATYLTKYITKDMHLVENEKRFWASKGLARPIKEQNPEWWKNIKPDLVYENEFGKLLIYSKLDTKELPDYVRKLTNGQIE